MTKPIKVNIYEPSEEFMNTVEDIAHKLGTFLNENEYTVNEVQAALTILMINAIEYADNPEEALARTQMSFNIYELQNVAVPEGKTLQ